MYGQAKKLISDATTVPMWWKSMADGNKGMSDYLNFFGRDVLLRSLRKDIAAGQKPPQSVLDEFPELKAS